MQFLINILQTPKIQKQMITRVTLRQKKINKGRLSLYLDFYPPIPHPETGAPTRREFLGLYIFEKPKTAIDKVHNSETLSIADGIRQKRENILNKPEIYSQYEKEQLKLKELGELNVVEYYKKMADKRRKSHHDNWVTSYNYFKNFTGGALKFADLNEKVLEAYKEYLLTTSSTRSEKTNLSQNSAVTYFDRLKVVLKQAFKDDILQFDISAKTRTIKRLDSKRQFLTLEEVNRLVKTPCNNDLLKRAAIFSALTGLRFSDIMKMVWSELEYVEERGHFLSYRQQKTKSVEVLPISEQAYSLCGTPGKPTDKVFDGLQYSAYYNKHLYQWIGAAGITKNITFHCFRHTYATLQLSNGTDIYTVSKMLGHRDLRSTQIYAKVVDEAKRKAADSIKLDL
jgi:Site-specific recombinase XerD